MAHLHNLVFKNKNFANSVIFEGRRQVLYQDFYKNASLLASSFSRIGIKKGDRIIIIAESSIAWVLVDVSSMLDGITTVPMFANSSSETLAFQFEDCGAQNIVVQNEEVLQKVLAIKQDFVNIFLVEKSKKFPEIKTIDELVFGGEVVNFGEIGEDDIATIVYTSGTSGKPKGVVITYKNLARQIFDIQASFHELNSSERAIAILPLAHIFQRTINLFYLSFGMNIYFVNDMQHVLAAMQEIKPTLITVVPRVLEKIHTRIISQVQTKPKLVRALILPILEYSSTHVIKNKVVRAVLNKLIFHKVLAVFGGKMKIVVSGGAKLNSKEEIFFANCGLNIVQGYGMTECCPVISSNTSNAKKLSTVGKPFASIEVKTLENGEICVRGESVFGGYLNQEKRDEKEFFHTGDAGFIDSDGFLTVTGRIKEQFKNANGKYINPVKIEDLLNSYGGVEASCIIAEGKPYTVAIIFSQISENEMKRIVDEINKRLDHHEQIQYFHISNEKATIENCIITPSLKLRRNDIVKKYADEIEKLYSN
jgi:long-chain acyl-CoA synthetase